MSEYKWISLGYKFSSQADGSIRIEPFREYIGSDDQRLRDMYERRLEKVVEDFYSDGSAPEGFTGGIQELCKKR